MKRLLTLFFSICMTMALAACGGNNTPPASSSDPSSNPSTPDTPTSSTPEPDSYTSATEDTSTASALVVYFSMPETTDPNNMTKAEEDSTIVVDGKVLGNTQYVALLIQESTGADIFRIEPVTPYPTDHETLVDLADKEQADAARPPIAGTIDNLDQYGTIFVGYPNWWGDMPMILYTFFDTYDFSGKTIIPFNTHGGSGFSNTIGTIGSLEPNATVEQNGFTMSRNDMEQAPSRVATWLSEVGF